MLAVYEAMLKDSASTLSASTPRSHLLDRKKNTDCLSSILIMKPYCLFTLFKLLAYLNYTPRTPSENWTPAFQAFQAVSLPQLHTSDPKPKLPPRLLKFAIDLGVRTLAS